MKSARNIGISVFMAALMLAVQTVPASPQQGREDYTVQHVTTFTDGKVEEIINLGGPDTDMSVSISLPNGAKVLSATMNITSMPGSGAGSDYVENLTMDAGNDDSFEYAFQGEGYGQMGLQTRFSNDGSGVYVNIPPNGGTNTTTTVRLPKAANVSSALLNISAGAGAGIAGNVLICAAEDMKYLQDIQTKLQVFPDVSAVDIIQAQTATPTLATLMQYDEVLVFSDFSFQDATLLGNNLADYIDAGGGVIVAAFAHGSGSLPLRGRFISEEYNVIVPGNCIYSAVSMGTVYEPNHPALNGVNAFSLVFHVNGSALTDGSHMIATFTDGSTMLASKVVNGTRRLDFGFYPVSGDAYPNQWTEKPDGQNLIHNSLCFVGRDAVNCSLDVGNDGSIEYKNPALNNTQTIQNISARLNSYLASAPPTGTDPYGNQYVDVPLAISSNRSGAVRLDNMSIVYRYTATVERNPSNGTLAEALNAMLPSRYDQKSTNIPLAISSIHAGKVVLSDLQIDYVPPDHRAEITGRWPEENLVLMDENSTAEFSITAQDPFGYPLGTNWTVNGRTVSRNSFDFSWYAGFDANGTYNVTVSVDNTLQKVATSWKVVVRDVNRLPIIESFSPETPFEMEENSTAIFEMSATDPDGGTLSYSWQLDGKRLPSDSATCEYKTTYSSAGKHVLRVTVLDVSGGSTNWSWNVTVKDVNVAPVIMDSAPPGDEVRMSENTSKRFSITDQSPDGDGQSVRWSLDGNDTGVTGRFYVYLADYDSAGTHVIRAEVSDGKLAQERVWTVTVSDVNRAPLAAISSPKAAVEFLLGEDIVFDGAASSDPDGDALTMTWSEAEKPIGAGNIITARLAKGRHIITLTVDDGKTGNATAKVEIYVRYIDFKGKMTIDILKPVEGQKLGVSATLTNMGDGSVDELPVSFRVDGIVVDETTVETVEPDSEFPLHFQWKAMKGEHKLEIGVNNQTFPMTVTVAQKEAPPAPINGMITMMIAAAAAVVIVSVVAVAFLGARRKAPNRRP